jgi:hypothetical protein
VYLIAAPERSALLLRLRVNEFARVLAMVASHVHRPRAAVLAGPDAVAGERRLPRGRHLLVGRQRELVPDAAAALAQLLVAVNAADENVFPVGHRRLVLPAPFAQLVLLY